MDAGVVIFGGGAAGLWLLDELVRRGISAVLLEAGELGRGQTVAAQGIIHGGLKYTLQGLLTRSAAEIRDMPGIWRDCVAGQREPDLSDTRIRSQSCFLWRTDSVTSRLGMIGAKLGLQVAPQTLSTEERPPILSRCPGGVARLDEQVISTPDLLRCLAARHAERLLKIDFEAGCELEIERAGQVRAIHLLNPGGGQRFTLYPQRVILTAGTGNAALRRQCGLTDEVMQRRPLHMLMVRGSLSELNGHCVDGNRTRVTITSDGDARGRTVWQVGGQLAEDGVTWQPQVLIERGRAELEAVIPGIDLRQAEWATYRVDRAEGVTAGGRRPDSCQVLQEGNVTTAWPTKLALVPRLAAAIITTFEETRLLREAGVLNEPSLPPDWPRPRVALPPWEACKVWWQWDEGEASRDRRQAA
jgi:glycerol-3-phosphate dehydrogenase